MLHRNLFLTNAVVVAAFLALGTVSAAPAGDPLTIPAFQHWYLVNSMIVTNEPAVRHDWRFASHL